MEYANCVGKVPRRSHGVKPNGDDLVPKEMDIFFPIRGQSKSPGKIICSACPVRKECDQYRKKTGSKAGMWGGNMIQKGAKE